MLGISQAVFSPWWHLYGEYISESVFAVGAPSCWLFFCKFFSLCGLPSHGYISESVFSLSGLPSGGYISKSVFSLSGLPSGGYISDSVFAVAAGIWWPFF